MTACKPSYPVLRDKRAATYRHVIGTVTPNQARDEVFGQVPNGLLRCTAAARPIELIGE